jgi:hypothetical protein
MAQRGSQELIILLSGLAVAAMCFSGVIVGGGLTPQVADGAAAFSE